MAIATIQTQEPSGRDDSEKSGERVPENTVKFINYRSKEVDIPEAFLHDKQPKGAEKMNFKIITWQSNEPPRHSYSGKPEKKDHVAYVIDNLLSPEECAQLLQYAEESAKIDAKNHDRTNHDSDKTGSASPWVDALVSVGPGQEIHMRNYRRSKRIIWDHKSLVRRIWDRCMQFPEMTEAMDKAVLADLSESVMDPHDEIDVFENGEPKWKLSGMNIRMRYLKYEKGDFFLPHNDGPYHEIADNGRMQRTFFTIHLYLNNSLEALKEAAEEMNISVEEAKQKLDPPLGNKEHTQLVGGSTAFVSRKEVVYRDVHCRAGRALVFQHQGMYHRGSEVKEGTKYTMRGDILYQRRPRMTRSKWEDDTNDDGNNDDDDDDDEEEDEEDEEESESESESETDETADA